MSTRGVMLIATGFSLSSPIPLEPAMVSLLLCT
jgi:hypothetical protein